MYLRKQYGESRIDGCPFCGKPSTCKNSQDVPVCVSHKNLKLDGLRCICGSFLDVLGGKWGPYCRCPNCGNVKFKRVLEMNPNLLKQAEAPAAEKKEKAEPKKREVEVIRSDELHLYY